MVAQQIPQSTKPFLGCSDEGRSVTTLHRSDVGRAQGGASASGVRSSSLSRRVAARSARAQRPVCL